MPVRSKLFGLYAIFVALYAATFFLPRSISTIQRYELNTLQYVLLSLSVAIPLALIWYTAFYGYYKLRAYTKLIKDTPDGRHVARIASGVMLLAIGLPVSGVASGIVGTLDRGSDPFIVGTIIKNYLSILFPLVGFIFISLGSRGLSNLSKQRPNFLTINILAIAFIIISVIYCYIIMTSKSLDAAYHLPTWAVMTTLVVPYLYIWFLGFVSAYELKLYSKKAPGTLYRKTWTMLASGLGAIIIMQIAFQYIGTATAQLESFRLARLLLIVYVLLALLSVGYILVAVGAKRLQRIEEV